MTFLLDTNVISEGSKLRPNGSVKTWLSQHASLVFISVMTIGEIIKGIERLSEGERRTNLHAWLSLVTSKSMAGRVLPVTSAVGAEWGRLNVALRRTLPCADSLLAATARVHGLTVATRNVRDFADFDVRLINPWTT